MNWYSFLTQFGRFTLTISCAVLANIISAAIMGRRRRARDSPLNRPPRSSIVWSGRSHDWNAKEMGSRILVFNANPFSMLSLVLWIAVFAVFVTAMERSAGDNIRIARPVDGEFVEQRFPIKGEAPGAPEGTYIFIVVRSMESQGALYEVSDVWTTGQHGWWQGVVHVPADVPVHGKVLVYAISASTPDYAVGQKYERPPRSSRKGGHTDAVTVKYLGN